MPASRARSRPAASERFETTTVIVASSSPAAIESMIDWRFDPRPEIRTARRRFTACSARRGRPGQFGRSPWRPIRRPAPAGRSPVRRSAAAQTTISPMPILKARNISSSADAPSRTKQLEDWRPLARRLDRSVQRNRRQHARQVLGDAAAGDVRHAPDDPASSSGSDRPADMTGACASSASPTDRPSSGTTVMASSRTARRTRGAPASSRWCEGRTTASRSAHRRARSPRPSTIRLRSTTPTMKPATSYSPSA